MITELEKEYCPEQSGELYFDLQDAIKGIQSIEQSIHDKQMLLTFWKREDMLRMSQFLQTMHTLMEEFWDEKKLQDSTKEKSENGNKDKTKEKK